MNAQYYSSEYLLKKYATNSDGCSLASMDEFNNRLDVQVSPSQSSEFVSINVPSTPKGSDNRDRRQFSNYKSNVKSTTHRRLARKGRPRKKMSYLQLEESGNIVPYDLEISIDNDFDFGNVSVGRIPVESPTSSTDSDDQLLVQKKTSDTENSDDGAALVDKRFDWDNITEDSSRRFDDRDFRLSDSRRPRKTIKGWAVWFLVGTVCACLTSTLIVYMTVMKTRDGRSVSFGLEKCTNSDHGSQRSVSDRYDTIRRHLLLKSAGNTTMMDHPGSPQREALCWISEFDDYDVDVTSGNEEAIIQRYSLAVLYFSSVKTRKRSNDDSGSLQNLHFLSAKHECDWDGIICDHVGEVMILRLSHMSLSGILPPEIGNLMSLSK
jgi:hypothetical protein